MARPSWLDNLLFGIRLILDSDEVELPTRSTVQFAGTGVTVADDVTNKRTVVTIGPGGSAVPTSRTINTTQGLTGGGDLSADLTLGLSGINDSQHGSRAGGTLHAAATTSVAGFMSAADKTKLDGLPAPADAATVTYVDGQIATCAPKNAAYLTNGAVSGLSNEVNIQALPTSLLFSCSGNPPVFFSRSEAAATGIYDVILLGRLTGAGQVGLGTGLGFIGADENGDEPQIARIAAVMADVTGSAVSAKLQFEAADAGSLVPLGWWDAAGITHDSEMASVTDTIAKRSGTGANAGAPRTLSAQDGQNVAAGTNNDGGDLSLSSGAAGTGGTGGDAGHVLIKVGGDTQISVEGDGSAVNFVPRVNGPRFVAAPSEPASSGAAVTFDLAESQNVKHEVTEATTVSFANAVEGMSGYIEVIQDGTGRTITMPTNGSGVEYSATIAALTVTGIIDATAATRTMLRYYVTGSPSTRVVIDQRAVSTIP